MAASPAAGHTARPQAASERITVALIPATADHLRRLQQRTNLSKTDSRIARLPHMSSSTPSFRLAMS